MPLAGLFQNFLPTLTLILKDTLYGVLFAEATYPLQDPVPVSFHLSQFGRKARGVFYLAPCATASYSN
jgi:hypothetical protein